MDNETRETIRMVYAALDSATEWFARASGVGCPPGCGTCCRGVSPAITRPEAEYVARFVVDEAPERIAAALERQAGSRSPCPFYDPDSSFHCTVYPARPLVCRAFGFTGNRDRHDRPSYRLCRQMPMPESFGRFRSYSSGTARAAQLPEPPDVHAFRLQMPLGDSDRDRGLHPLDVAVGDAILALLLTRRLSSAEASGVVPVE